MLIFPFSSLSQCRVPPKASTHLMSLQRLPDVTMRSTRLRVCGWSRSVNWWRRRVSCQVYVACSRRSRLRNPSVKYSLPSKVTSYQSVALAFTPRTDGTFLSEQAQHLLAKGHYSKVPMISGDQWDEGKLGFWIVKYSLTDRQALQGPSWVWEHVRWLRQRWYILPC